MRRGPFQAFALLLALTLVTADATISRHVLRGAVLRVSPESGELDVVMGVGMALRIAHVQIPAPLREDARMAAVQSELRPGDIVEIECDRTEVVHVADRIEKVRR